jgi:hypothetical protein
MKEIPQTKNKHVTRLLKQEGIKRTKSGRKRTLSKADTFKNPNKTTKKSSK